MSRLDLRRFTAILVAATLGATLIPNATQALAGTPELQGAAGRRATKGSTFASFAAVVAYGVDRYPDSKPARPPEERTAEFAAAKERANSGEGPATSKQLVAPERAGRAKASRKGPRSLPAPTPNAPVLGRTFSGITGGNPPDTHLAVGPHNIVVVANSGVRILTKGGTVLGTATPTLQQFFASQAALAFTFDPRAVFDPYLSRFWIIAVDEADPTATAAGTSRIFVALSATDDAAGAWTFFTLNAALDGNTPVTQWCDYPMFGVSRDAVHFSCNMFNFPAQPGTAFRYAKIRQMTKAQFVNNACCLWWDTWNLREGAFGIDFSFTVQPAVMYGSTGNEAWFIDSHRGSPTNNTLEVRRATNVAACCVPGNQQSPTWVSHNISVGGFPMPPDATQPGANLLDTGDTRLQFAVWQGDRLSTGLTTACRDNTNGGFDACVSFTELDVTGFPNGMAILNDWVFDPADGTDDFYPAVVPNASGARTMTYTRSSASENPTAVYQGIPANSTCTSCIDGPETTILAGAASPTCTPMPGQTTCTVRWGDYHGAAPDPDGTGVWIASQAFATVAGTARRVSQVALTREAGDFTPPVTTASLSPAPSDDGWVMGKPVTLTLNSTDAGVGPWKITYNTKSGPVVLIPTTTVTATTTSIQIQLEGTTEVTFYGTDDWGNVEAPKTIAVKVDGRTQKIAFATQRHMHPGGTHEVYVMNADGTNQVRLTNNVADDTQPVLDQFGRVFFTSDRDGDYDIYRLDRSGAVVQLTNDPAADVNPAVTDDGNKVAFASDRGGDFDIYTMTADGAGLVGPINDDPELQVEPEWSPNGARMAYVQNDPWGGPPPNDDLNIHLTNPLRIFSDVEEERRPSWHPDGTKVAGYLRGDLLAYDVSSNARTSLIATGAVEDSPTWSPHGGSIAFQSDTVGNYEIYRMPASGGPPVRLTHWLGHDVEPDWMPLIEGYTPGVEMPPATLSTLPGIKRLVKVLLDPDAPYALLENRIIVPLPEGLKFENPTVPGGDCRIDESAMECFIGGIEPGAARELTFDVIAGAPGTYPLQAFTESANGDPSSALRMMRVVPDPLPTATVGVSDSGYEPSALTVDQGTGVTWRFGGSRTQTVTDLSKLRLFDSGPRGAGSSFTYRFRGAGTFAYGSTRSAAHRGTVGVPVDVTESSIGLAIGWASARVGAGLGFDVQVRFRAPGGTWSDWGPWRSGATTLADLFEPDRGPGGYGFRARMRNLGTNAASGWSPTVFVVVGTPPG